MHEIDELNVKTLHGLAIYLIEHKKNVEQIIQEFGNVYENNGYGTVFLKPFNNLFRVIWVHQEENCLKSFGLGGSGIMVSFRDLIYAYQVPKLGYIPYDENHVYAFQKIDNPGYTIRVYSKDKLMEGDIILKDVIFHQMDIAINDD